MQFRTFEIRGPIEIVPDKIEDERGYFSEIFRAELFEAHAGRTEFVQDNQSLNVRPGTIRGIHFQTAPAAQGKLVRCISGKVMDVAVDLRWDSPSYGRWLSVTLSSELNNQLWLPVGFGHGFCTLEPNSIIGYRVTSYYSPTDEGGLAWDDPDVGIEWPAIADPDTLSAKDRGQPRLAQLQRPFSMAEA